ncbi:bifunctional adenosylcobinamide kinase/adenosylcobinamide-phosphate guanylyltransferase, partial [Methylibium sp. T29]|uniref:bifunctional adenosylcobinamide kinase/adenosylcobinamide-phosphate guanylyltransferase n=1 Tax=Methylibium sp. T29 TaxID=1430884 RepID=UPI00056BAD94
GAVRVRRHGLGDAIRRLADPAHLLVVDCLTLWLAQWLMPPPQSPMQPAMQTTMWPPERESLLDALQASTSPLVLVSNEIGLGVMPMSREARACVDTLGHLHQAVAQRCVRVTLMVAGCELRVKDDR